MKYKIINRKKLFATIFFDIIGYITFLPAIMLREKKEEIDDNIKEILIIRTAYIGDIIMALPILKPLKEKFPKARISFLASKEGGELLKGNPYIDRIFHLNPFWFYNSSVKEYMQFIKRIRLESFDLIIEARGDIRELLFIVFPLKSRFKLSYAFGGGAYLLTHIVPFRKIKHRIEYHLDLIRHFGCPTSRIEWGLYLSGDEKRTVEEILKKNGINRPFISVHPGSRLPLKQWPSEQCAILYDKIIEELNISLVILGAKQEKRLVEDIVRRMKNKPVVLAGHLSLREVSGILSKTTIFVCNDSAPMHIASAMKTPTVGIFGPSKSIETGPYGNNCRVVEKMFPCRYTCDESVCRHKIHNDCMKSITVDDVFNEVVRLME